jgi:hypothetical protein
MKRFLHIILFTLFSIQVQAATLNWNKAGSIIESSGFRSQETEPDKQTLTGGIDFNAAQGPITDTWAFTLNGANAAGIAVSSLVIEFTNDQMDVGSITLDGNLFTADNGTVNLWTSNATLDDGVHFVTLNGINVLDEAAQYDIKISVVGDGLSAVPVPAAVWMFGSGLIGLVSFSRRKSKS